MAPNPPQSELPELPHFTREEVARHKTNKDCWIIVHGEIYNVTSWLSKHPGGARLLEHYAGQDASAAWTSFHNNKQYVRGFLKNYHVGHLVPAEREQPEVVQEFYKLRNQLEQKGLFKVNPWFFIAHFSHIILLTVAAWLLLWYYGNNWTTWLISTVLIVTSQAQAGWLQHDFGHLCVFNSSTLNHLCHDGIIGLLKGVSSFWWNYRHFQHHAKPNVFLKDPDITAAYIFLIGKIIPEKWGKKRWGTMPYQYQHHYFFLIGPPLLLPIYFHVEVLFYVLKRQKWKDLLCMLAFYITFHMLFSPLLGGFWANFKWYFFIRVLESHWFVWATQISHLPMAVDTDRKKDWVSMQLHGTRNVSASFFNDWFLGHLNFQIEHHLFPTMPRHNFYKAQPYVKELCKKYDLDYQLVPLWTSFGDIIRSLKESGQIWLKSRKESSSRKRE